jgi:hypothetical protein
MGCSSFLSTSCLSIRQSFVFGVKTFTRDVCHLCLLLLLLLLLLLGLLVCCFLLLLLSEHHQQQRDEAEFPTAARSLGWAGKIRVPFPFESQLSGVPGHRVLERSQFLWYRRSFRLSDVALGSSGSSTSSSRGGGGGGGGSSSGGSGGGGGGSKVPLRYFLNFEAVDYACAVWVNDVEGGGHRGGSTPFRLEISDAVAAVEQPGARNDLMVGGGGGGCSLSSMLY